MNKRILEEVFLADARSTPLFFSDSRSDFAIRSRLVHDFFHNSVVRFLVEVLGETVNCFARVSSQVCRR